MIGLAHRAATTVARTVTSAAVALAAVVGSAAGAPAPATAAGAAVPASFVLTGSGFGHGVGMSQYGAYGQAKAGRTATQILTHYYTGTKVEPAPDDRTVLVNVAYQAPSVAYRVVPLAPGAEVVSTAAGAAAGQPVTTSTGSASRTFSATVESGRVRVRWQSGGTTYALGAAPAVEVRWTGTRALAGPAALVDVGGRTYRHGSLRLTVENGRLNAVLALRQHDEYLYGIAEMPSSWPAAALQAQAIAARTYAMNVGRSLKEDCDCHLRNGVVHQVYAGWSKESEPTYGRRWTDAVRATSPSSTTGLVVTHGGKPISTYYYSSSGGATQNSEDVWSAALPYARSVKDFWSVDPTINKSYAAWTRTVSQSTITGAFGLPDVVKLDLSQRTTGRGVARAVATSSGGVTASMTGEKLRSRLGLPATWLRRAVERHGGSDRYGTAVALGRAAFPSGRTVVLVNGTERHLVDGLVAGPLAYRLGGPVLLVRHGDVPGATAAEIRRRGATTAHLVGGSGAVSDAVVSQLRALGITAVTRHGGGDRWATSAAVARAVGARGGAAVVASGADRSLVDALAAAGPAARAGRPILLVAPEAVPPATGQALRDLGVISTTLVGGPAAVSEAVRAALPAAVRAGGSDRWATAAAVATAFRGVVPADRVTVAAGTPGNLVDALAAGALGQLTVLVGPEGPPPAATEDVLQRTAVMSRLSVAGGPAAVSDDVLIFLKEA